MSRVYKARYFPSSSLLDAKLGANPSYIWSSIFSAKGVLAKGLRYRVGNGKSVRIFSDPWLLDVDNPRVATSPPPNMVDVTVDSLRDVERPGWDVDILRDIFLPRDRDLISKIPVCGREEEDTWFWISSSDGSYSVKSGYRLCRGEVLPQASPFGVFSWKALWSLVIPVKMVIFLWRACSGSLPTLSVLASRFVPVDLECPRCSVDYETVLHALCLCPFAKDCLSKAGLWRVEADAGTFKEWWQWHKSSLSVDDLCRLAAVLWSIWWSRNKKVWSGIEEMSHYVGLNGLDEWRAAKAAPASGVLAGDPSPVSGGLRPAPGFVKCNFDAAVFASEGFIGFGCVLRDESSSFVRASNGLLVASGDALLAEALSFREALSWIRRVGTCNVCFESDSLLLVKAFRSQSGNRSYFGSIVEDCRVLASEFSNFDLVFVPRSANQVAHSLARASGSSSGSGSWESVPPPFIVDALSFDLI